MDKLSGLMLDVHDDPAGQLFREIFPTQREVPELIKSARLLTEAERRALPDDMFALVLRDGDVTLRKFACIDPGNVALSMVYFAKTAEKLPLIAQKVAAKNLLLAEDWYKTAGIGGALLGAAGSGLGGLAGKAVGYAAKNPMKALSGAMAGYSVLQTAKDIGGRLKNAPSGQLMQTVQG